MDTDVQKKKTYFIYKYLSFKEIYLENSRCSFNLELLHCLCHYVKQSFVHSINFGVNSTFDISQIIQY